MSAHDEEALLRLARAAPRFVGTEQDELAPVGGPGGTTFSDSAIPSVGVAYYYLVINRN